MAKVPIGQVKLQIPAGQATPAPPVGQALGQWGVNIMDFCKAYNARTEKDRGSIIPAIITIYSDKSYTFVVKTPPASDLLKKASGIAKGSPEPNKAKVGKISREKLREIASIKMPDLNANDLETAEKIIRGTARNMGIEIEE